MGKTIQERREELERTSNVTHIESKALLLVIGETKSFRIKDIQAFQQLRTRLCRHKDTTGRRFKVKMSGYSVYITRVEVENETEK